MRVTLRKTIAGVAMGATLTGAGVITADATINPYTDKGEKFEIASESLIPSSGENKIELAKDAPEVTFSKWSGEEYITVRYDDVKAKGARKFMSEKVEWKSGPQEIHAYPIDAGVGMEDGGFEIDIILNEKPGTNKFDFAIDGTDDLDFFYQDALWKEAGLSAPTMACNETYCDHGDGDVDQRSENAVGSYAVYHKLKRDFAQGETNYATGKMYHIYRPKVFDADGAEIWGDLSYEKGVLSITVPQDFLDNATYPVRVDPSFGYTTVGVSNGVFAANTVRGFAPYTNTYAATVHSIYIYDSNATASGFMRGVLYASSTLAYLDAGTQADLEGTGWLNYDMNDVAVSAATDYMLGVWIDGTNFSSFAWDNVVGNQVRDDLTYHATNPPNNPFVVDAFTSASRKTSIYAAITITAAIDTYKKVETFNSSTNWTAPPGVTSVSVEVWAGGGGGTTAVGAGGGGAYSASTTTVVPGTVYAATVGIGGAVNTNGATSSFNGVVASPGLSGTNGGKGGLASTGSGTTKYSGGDGAISAVAAGGGGGAGDSANGTNGDSLGEQSGGSVNGGLGGNAANTTSQGKVPGGGGSAQAATQNVGQRGLVRISYTEVVPPLFPSIQGRSYGRDAADATSRAISMPSGITAGELLVIVAGSDGDPTITESGGGWTKLGQVTDSSNAVTQAIFYKTAAGSDTATIDTSASEQVTYIAMRIKSGGTPTGTSASSAGSSIDPPSHSPGSTADYLWLATGSVDGTISADIDVTAPPVGYGGLVIQPRALNDGVNTYVSELFKNGSSDNPSVFSQSATQEVAMWTISIPYSAAAAAGGATTNGIILFE